MGRGVARKPIPPALIQELFYCGNDGALKHRRRSGPDPGNANRLAAENAGWITRGGVRMVRFKFDGHTRRVQAGRVAWALHAGQWPRGPIAHRNGDAADFSAGNLIERGRGPNRRGGISRLQRETADRALIDAMAANPNASLRRLSALVGSTEPSTCVRLSRLAKEGLCAGPECCVSRHWLLTRPDARLPLDALDKAVLVALARCAKTIAAVMRRTEVAELTSARRLRELATRGLAERTPDGWRVTAGGIAALGPDAPTPWVTPLSAAQAPDVMHRRANDRTRAQIAAESRGARVWRARMTAHAGSTGA